MFTPTSAFSTTSPSLSPSVLVVFYFWTCFVERTRSHMEYNGQLNAAGEPHGKGAAKYANEDKHQRLRFEGEWRNGHWDGKGCAYWQSVTLCFSISLFLSVSVSLYLSLCLCRSLCFSLRIYALSALFPFSVSWGDVDVKHSHTHTQSTAQPQNRTNLTDTHAIPCEHLHK